LTDATVEADGQLQAAEEDAAAVVGHETPALQQAIRPVSEDVRERRGTGQRQFLQNALGAATAAVAAGVAGVANVGGIAGAVANAAVGRQQVTVYVTRVDRVVDDRLTATLVPKNCMPARVDALRRCNGAVNPYSALSETPYITLPQPAYMQKQPAVAVDIVSKVGGLVRDFVDAQAAATAADGGRLRRYRYATTAADSVTDPL